MLAAGGCLEAAAREVVYCLARLFLCPISEGIGIGLEGLEVVQPKVLRAGGGIGLGEGLFWCGCDFDAPFCYLDAVVRRGMMMETGAALGPCLGEGDKAGPDGSD